MEEPDQEIRRGRTSSPSPKAARGETPRSESVPLGVTTWTVPLLAPEGTAGGDFGRTHHRKYGPRAVEGDARRASQIVPRILTDAPTLPEVVCVSTNGPRATSRLKTVPSP